MNRMKCGFYTYRGIAFCFVTAMFCGQAMAQVVEKRGLILRKRLMRLITRLFVLLICLTDRCIPCAISRLMIYAKLSVSYLIRREVLSPC